MSGALEWRDERGEVGVPRHSFQFVKPGAYSIHYHTAADEYRVFCDGKIETVIESYLEGAYDNQHIFRKVEKDWKQVYLARYGMYLTLFLYTKIRGSQGHFFGDAVAESSMPL